MSKFTSLQNSFSSGELSPKLDGRSELQEYSNGAQTQENFLNYKSGGVFRRPGTRAVHSLVHVTNPFLIEYPTGAANYIVCISPNQGSTITLEYHLDAAISLNTATDTFTIAGHGYSDGDMIRAISDDGVGSVPAEMTEHLFYEVRDVAGNDFKLDDGSGGVLDLVTDGTSYNLTNARFPIEIYDATNDNVIAYGLGAANMTYSEGQPGTTFLNNQYTISDALDKDGFQYAQQGDILFITHNSGSMEPIIIYPQDSNGNTFYIKPYKDWYNQGFFGLNTSFLGVAFKKMNETATTLLVDDWGVGSRTMTASAATFTSSMIGSYIMVEEDGVRGVCQITAYASSTEVTVYIFVEFEDATKPTTAVTSWYLNSWSDVEGWPRTVSSYQQRLIWGGTTQLPDTCWATVVANPMIVLNGATKPYSNGATPGQVTNLEFYSGSGLSDDDAFRFIVGYGKVDNIRWMSTGRTLDIGTDTGEFTVSGTTAGFKHDTWSSIQNTSHGAKGVMPTRTDRTTMFVSKDGKEIIDYRYSEENGSNVTRNLSVLSDRMVYYDAPTTGGFSALTFKRMAWAASWGALFIRTSAGKLVVLAVEESSGMIAWSKHPIAGTDVTVEGICVIPNSTGDFEEIWLSVSRTINSTTVSYLEKIGREFEHTTLDNDSTDVNDLMWYSDCAASFSNAVATITPSGFQLLEGETVEVVADGAYVGTSVISGGICPLTVAANKVVAGLAYNATVTTMKLEKGSKIGNSQIQISRIDKVLLKLYRALNGKYGRDTSDLYDIEYDNVSVTSGETFTGDVQLEFIGSADETQQVTVKHTKPLPFSLLAVVMRGLTQD